MLEHGFVPAEVQFACFAVAKQLAVLVGAKCVWLGDSWVARPVAVSIRIPPSDCGRRLSCQGPCWATALDLPLDTHMTICPPVHGAKPSPALPCTTQHNTARGDEGAGRKLPDYPSSSISFPAFTLVEVKY